MAIPAATSKWVGVVYSPADIRTVAQAAGFSGQDVDIAQAVAQAESGGRVDAIGGPNPDSVGSYDYGLFQINGYWHPEKFAGRDWSNPATNASMAHQVFMEAGGSWAPWSTYSSGAYTKHLGDTSTEGGTGGGGPTPGETPGGGASADPFSSVTEPLSAIGAMIYTAGKWLGDADNWVRILQVTVGGVLTVAALSIVAKPAVGTLPGPVGKITKLVT